MLLAREDVVVAGKLPPRLVIAKGGLGERSGVHAKRGEQPNVAPLTKVVARLATLIDAEGQFQAGGVQGGFQTDGSCTENGEAWRVRPRHEGLLPRMGAGFRPGVEIAYRATLDDSRG